MLSAKGQSDQLQVNLVQYVISNVPIFETWNQHCFFHFSSSPLSLLHILPPSLAFSASHSLSPGFQLENGCCGNVESYHKCVYVKKRVGDGERERTKRRKGTVVSDARKMGQEFCVCGCSE